MGQAIGYDFDPDSIRTPLGATIIRDLTGGLLDGTLTGDAEIAAGKYTKGLHCHGGGLLTEITRGWYPLANVSAGYSICAQVKLDDDESAVRTIASVNSNGTTAWTLLASDEDGFVSCSVGAQTYQTDVSVRDGEWHFIGVAYDFQHTTMSIWIDSAEVFTDSIPSNALTYNASFGAELAIGYDAVSGEDPLNGTVDDFRWWADPVDDDMWPTLESSGQQDLLLGIYSLDGDGVDLSTYGRPLTIRDSAEWVPSIYFLGLQSGSAEAGGYAHVNYGSVDRMTITGVVTIDEAPGSTAPLLYITDDANASKFELICNSDLTLTTKWHTIADGTITTTSTNSLTVGQPTQVYFTMNPTYCRMVVGTRLNATQTQTNITGGVPHLSPEVANLNQLYVGGSPSFGGSCTWDFLNIVQNYLDTTIRDRWVNGPQPPQPYRPVGMRGIWSFEESSGPALDLSTNGNTLTLDVAATRVDGHVTGKALSSVGTGGGAFRAGGVVWGESPFGFSAAAWVKFNTAASLRNLWLGNGSDPVLQFGRSSGGLLYVQAYNSAAEGTGSLTLNPTLAIGSSSLATDTWYHVAISCDGYSFAAWLNGVELLRESAHTYRLAVGDAAISPVSRIYVGSDNAGSSSFINTINDDVYVSEVPLTAMQVRYLYELGAGIKIGINGVQGLAFGDDPVVALYVGEAKVYG